MVGYEHIQKYGDGLAMHELVERRANAGEKMLSETLSGPASVSCLIFRAIRIHKHVDPRRRRARANPYGSHSPAKCLLPIPKGNPGAPCKPCKPPLFGQKGEPWLRSLAKGLGTLPQTLRPSSLVNRTCLMCRLHGVQAISQRQLWYSLHGLQAIRF